jgi:hypothetical protein
VTDFDLWRMMMLGNPSSCYYMLQLSVWSFVSFYFHGIFNILVFVYFHITSGNTWTAKLIIWFIAAEASVDLVKYCWLLNVLWAFNSTWNVFFFSLLVSWTACITTGVVHHYLPDSQSCYAGFIGCRCTVKGNYHLDSFPSG